MIAPDLLVDVRENPWIHPRSIQGDGGASRSKLTLFGCIEIRRRLRRPVYGRKICAHPPCDRCSSRKPSCGHLLTLFLVAVNHYLH